MYFLIALQQFEQGPGHDQDQGQEIQGQKQKDPYLVLMLLSEGNFNFGIIDIQLITTDFSLSRILIAF